MNSLSELKEAFHREHVRDRRLTLINYFLILCGIAILVGVLLFLGVDFAKLFASMLVDYLKQDGGGDSITKLYYMVVPVIAFTCVFGYPFYQLWKINKRSKKIEELIGRAEKGAKLASVDENVVYKITLPVLKINLKICPVTFVHILLEGDFKPYILPIRNIYIPDMKVLFSGVNMEELNQHKAALYEDVNNETSTEETNTVPTPLKSTDEFRTFLDKELKDDLTSLESSRKSIRKTMVIGGIIAGIVIVCVMGYVFFKSFSGYTISGSGFNPLTSVVPIFALGIFISIFFSIIMKKKHANTPIDQSQVFGSSTFKEKVISRMVSFINPSVKYIPLAHLALRDVFESGLFQERNYTLDGSDQISGRYNGVPFISCDLSMYFKRNFSEENDSPDCAFYGQFFVARFNKTFSTPTYIVPTKNKYSTLSYLIDNKGEKVKLEDPEFMKMFHVYSNDQLEARYILTPSLMERIKELAKRVKGEFYIAFYNNKITVANNSGINNFEASFSKSLVKDDNELLVGFYTDMCNQFAIIDELKLNLNIWKK